MNYIFLENNVKPTSSDELLLNSFEETWSKPLDKKTNLSLDARQSLTETGTVPAALLSMPAAATGAQDMRDLSGSINLSRKVGAATLTMGGQRDWLHNTLFPENSTITSSINAGYNLVVARTLSIEYAGERELGGRRWIEGGRLAQLFRECAADAGVEEANCAACTAD